MTQEAKLAVDIQLTAWATPASDFEGDLAAFCKMLEECGHKIIAIDVEHNRVKVIDESNA